MDLSILKSVGQVAGIGGLALGIFLILFRNLLRKIKVPFLRQDQWYNIIIIFMILVWSIAIIGIVVWHFSNNNGKVLAEDKQRAFVKNQSYMIIDEMNKIHPEYLKSFEKVYQYAKRNQMPTDEIVNFLWAQRVDGDPRRTKVRASARALLDLKYPNTKVAQALKEFANVVLWYFRPTWEMGNTSWYRDLIENLKDDVRNDIIPWNKSYGISGNPFGTIIGYVEMARRTLPLRFENVLNKYSILNSLLESEK